MVKKEKVKTIQDVEKEELGNPDELKQEEKKQGELEGMPEKVALVDGKPAKTKMEKQAVLVGEMFEDMKKLSEAVVDEKNKLLDLMKEAGKQMVVLKTVQDNTYDVAITSTDEKISLRKHKEEML